MVEKWFCNWGSDLQCIFSHNLFVSAKKRSNNGAAIKSCTQTRARSNSNNDKKCIQNVISLCGVRVATLNGALFPILHKSIYRISTHELAKIETKWIGELQMPIGTRRRAGESERERDRNELVISSMHFAASNLCVVQSENIIVLSTICLDSRYSIAFA